MTFQDWEGLEEEVHQDEKLKGIMQTLLLGEESQQEFKLNGGRLYYKNRLVAHKGSPRIQMILQEFHNTALVGTLGSLGPIREFQDYYGGSG